MNAVEKQNAAFFLDIASDFLGCGYRSAKKDYHFEDDKAAPQEASFSAEPSVSVDSIEKIKEEIGVCKNCSLCGTRKNTVPGEGVSAPVVMVIGEGPGQDEDAQGRPFVGRAGQLLDKMLASINLSRNTNCYIANVVKCRPPQNRDPHPEETAACGNFLERQISVLKPKFILAAGRVSAQTLLKTTEPVGKLRGIFKEINAANTVYPLLVTYHPAALLRNEDLKRPAWEDLKLLRLKIENLNGDN